MTRIAYVILEGLDLRLDALKQGQRAAGKPARGWLRAIREATGLSQARVARKLSVSKQSYSETEAAEARGTITLNSLQRAAEAMDCELVYFVVPRPTVAESFAALARHHDPDMRHLKATEHSMALEGQAVGDIKNVRALPDS